MFASCLRAGVFSAARASGWPDDAQHRNYFSVPEGDAGVRQPLVLRRARSGRR